MHQCANQAQLLAHAMRVVMGKRVASIPEVHRGKELLHAGHGITNALNAGEVQNVFPTRDATGLGRFFGDDTDVTAEFERVALDLLTKHKALAARGLYEIEQHMNGRSLARAIWAEESVDLRTLDVKVKAFDGNMITVALGESMCGDQG